MASLAAVRTWQHGALFLPAVKTGPDSHNGTAEYFMQLVLFSTARAASPLLASRLIYNLFRCSSTTATVICRTKYCKSHTRSRICTKAFFRDRGLHSFVTGVCKHWHKLEISWTPFRYEKWGLENGHLKPTASGIAARSQLTLHRLLFFGALFFRPCWQRTCVRCVQAKPSDPHQWVYM